MAASLTAAVTRSWSSSTSSAASGVDFNRFYGLLSRHDHLDDAASGCADDGGSFEFLLGLLELGLKLLGLLDHLSVHQGSMVLSSRIRPPICLAARTRALLMAAGRLLVLSRRVSLTS